MKKIILIVFLCFINTPFAQSQLPQLSPDKDAEICLTPSNSINVLDLNNLRGLDHTNDKMKVKLYFHVLRKEQRPKRGQSIEGVNRIMKILYDDFDQLDIHFVWDGKINYIDNDSFYINPRTNASEIFNTDNHYDGVDIYVYDELDAGEQFGAANGVGQSTELLFGGYFYPSSVVGDKFYPLSRLKFISHLMGHVLNLNNTHFGTQGNDGCPELVDGSNSKICGDFVADTPADPNLFIYNTNNETCGFEPEMWNVGDFYDVIPPEDQNGGVYQPDTTNLMSHTYLTCWDTFTAGQKSRMKNSLWYVDSLRATLLDSYTYIRPIEGSDCFVCDSRLFTVNSSLNISNLSVTSTNNIQTDIISTTLDSFTIKVTNIMDNSEGERGSFNVINNTGGIDNNVSIVSTQLLWVGLPKTLPSNTLTGTEIVQQAGQGAFHRIENRLEGIDTYGWNVPEPSRIIWGWESQDPNLWSHYGYDKYYFFSSAFSGNQTGYVQLYGVNSCGNGSSGSGNKICVVNLDDPDGDTECEDVE